MTSTYALTAACSPAGAPRIVPRYGGNSVLENEDIDFLDDRSAIAAAVRDFLL